MGNIGAAQAAAAAARLPAAQQVGAGSQPDAVSKDPNVAAHRGTSSFQAAAKRPPVRLAGDNVDSAAMAIRNPQPPPGHNGGPPMASSQLTGPTVKSTTADPTKGSRDPANLTEQAAVNQARANPEGGKQIVSPEKMAKDPRYDGYEKRAQTIRTNQGDLDVHYNYDPKTKHATDFKIANQPKVAPEDAAGARRVSSSDGKQYGVGRDGFYKYDGAGRFEAKVNSVRDLPADVRGRVGNMAMSRIMRGGGFRGILMPRFRGGEE